MKRYGGSFVMRLGDAALYADTENLQAIKTAFPVIWAHYTVWAHYTEAAKREKIESAAEALHKANFQDTRSWPLGASPDHYLYNPTPPFRHCNVCGCVLRGDSEFAMGMCTAHANEGAGL